MTPTMAAAMLIAAIFRSTTPVSPQFQVGGSWPPECRNHILVILEPLNVTIARSHAGNLVGFPAQDGQRGVSDQVYPRVLTKLPVTEEAPTTFQLGPPATWIETWAG